MALGRNFFQFDRATVGQEGHRYAALEVCAGSASHHADGLELRTLGVTEGASLGAVADNAALRTALQTAPERRRLLQTLRGQVFWHGERKRESRAPSQ
eukprot:7905543-Pyramimonas_sp.AAC.1